MDPFTIAGLASAGIGIYNGLFNQPQVPDFLGMQRQLAWEAHQRNLQLVEQRQNEMNAASGAAMARLGLSRQYAQRFMGLFDPQLAFAEQQGRLTAETGARAAQASVRRQLGSGGDIFAAQMQAGARTGAAAQANTLRAMATTEAQRAGMNQAMSEAQLQMQRAGMNASLPIPMMQTPGIEGAIASYTARANQNQQTTGLFGNLATGLGYLGQQRMQAAPPKTQQTLPSFRFTTDWNWQNEALADSGIPRITARF